MNEPTDLAEVARQLEVNEPQAAIVLSARVSPRDQRWIKPTIRAAIDRFGELGYLPGGFLVAVLSNDLADACARADDENAVTLAAIASYCRDSLPYGSWGSLEKVKAWDAAHRDLRQVKP